MLRFGQDAAAPFCHIRKHTTNFLMSAAPETTTAAPDPESTSNNRLGLVLAILLAALGLMGALTAWRVGLAGDTASDAAQAALLVSRARAAAEVSAEGTINQTMTAWIDYERNTRRAEDLRSYGINDEALRADMAAAAHWFAVRPEYINTDGQYDPARHRAALMAEAASREDLDPAPHLAAAESEEARIAALLAAGVVLGLALPIVTLGELTARRRLRLASALAGAVVLSIGSGMVVLAWV